MAKQLLGRIELQNFLSYPGDSPAVELVPLNVLIGPNASGKSNMLEALALLRASVGDLSAAIREGGGISEYLWKGANDSEPAVIQTAIAFQSATRPAGVAHRLELARSGSRFELNNEVLTVARVGQMIGELRYIYRDDHGRSRLYSTFTTGTPVDQGGDIRTSPDDLKPDQSILSQRRDPDLYPELTYLAEQFGRIALFQDWNVGRRSAVRLPQPTDLPNDFLLSDGSNLGLILHDLSQTSAKREELGEYLRKFYERARYITTKIQGGTLQLYIEEEGGRLIPATRLSDGTLRYLCLLAILLHPNPPPVIGIEEPELGLHPDILPTIAELLRKASERTQLFVTTHSETLVSALSDTPECILVCESTPIGTTMKRLEAEPLREWLEKYSLGELWRMGEIGGNRW